MHRMMLIILTLLSFAHQTLGMDPPSPPNEASVVCEQGFSISSKYEFDQNVYLPFYKKVFATKLSEADLGIEVTLHGPEKAMTAFFATLFGYIKVLQKYPAGYADAYNGKLEELPQSETDAIIPIDYAYTVLDYILKNFFNPAELDQAIDASFSVYKDHAKRCLSEEEYLFSKNKFDQSTSKWNDTFCHFESRLLKNNNDIYLDLFLESFVNALNKLPKKLKKSPFSSTKERKKLCEWFKKCKNTKSEEEECYMKPWFDHIENFTYNKDQRKYAKRACVFFRVKFNEQSKFYHENIEGKRVLIMPQDVFSKILLNIANIWLSEGNEVTSCPMAIKNQTLPTISSEPKLVLLTPASEKPLVIEQATTIKDSTKQSKKKNKPRKLSERLRNSKISLIKK